MYTSVCIGTAGNDMETISVPEYCFLLYLFRALSAPTDAEGETAPAYAVIQYMNTNCTDARQRHLGH